MQPLFSPSHRSMFCVIFVPYTLGCLRRSIGVDAIDDGEDVFNHVWLENFADGKTAKVFPVAEVLAIHCAVLYQPIHDALYETELLFVIYAFVKKSREGLLRCFLCKSCKASDEFSQRHILRFFRKHFLILFLSRFRAIAFARLCFR